MDQSEKPPPVRSAGSELALLGGLAVGLVGLAMLAIGHYPLAAFKLLLAIGLVVECRDRDLRDGVTPLIRWTPPRWLRNVYRLAWLYLACWFVSYSVQMQGDFRYVDRYFIQGWSGGLETPAFIQFTALAATGVLGVIGGSFAIWRRRAAKGQATA